MTEACEEKTDLLSSLPADIFYNDLFPYLDIFSLINVASTCQYFHRIANADVSWRYRIQKKFGFLPNELPDQPYKSYKRLFIERPCLRYDGVYISRCLYYRTIRKTGNIHLSEEERKGRKHEPLVLAVCYFRYLMFIPNTSRCLCMRSEAPKQEAIKVMKDSYAMLQRQPHYQQLFREANPFGTGNNSASDERGRLMRQVVLAEWSFQQYAENEEEEQPPSYNEQPPSYNEQPSSYSEAEPDSPEPLLSRGGVVTLRYFEESNFNWTRYLNEAQLRLSDQRLVDPETHSHYRRWNSKLDWLNFSITAAGQTEQPLHSLSLNSTHFKPFIFCRIRSLAHNF